jgi:hypothetical protein
MIITGFRLPLSQNILAHVTAGLPAVKSSSCEDNDIGTYFEDFRLHTLFLSYFSLIDMQMSGI